MASVVMFQANFAGLELAFFSGPRSLFVLTFTQLDMLFYVLVFDGICIFIKWPILLFFVIPRSLLIFYRYLILVVFFVDL